VSPEPGVSYHQSYRHTFHHGFAGAASIAWVCRTTISISPSWWSFCLIWVSSAGVGLVRRSEDERFPKLFHFGGIEDVTIASGLTTTTDGMASKRNKMADFVYSGIRPVVRLLTVAHLL